MSETASDRDFWKWLFHGSGGASPGIFRLLTGWLLFHILVGIGVAFAVPLEVSRAAQVVLIPMAGVFVGLTFAWVANVQMILLTDEIERLAKYVEGGYPTYVFSFQLGMLIVLASLVMWGIAGLGVFDSSECIFRPGLMCSNIAKVVLFSSVSVALRECWHLIKASMILLVYRQEIRDVTREASEGSRKD